ncbi:MAG TPA: hypothetical protein VH419_16770, partial [Nocardioidaceae bacterium]
MTSLSGVPALALDAGRPAAVTDGGATMAADRWDADEAVTQLYAAHYTALVRLAALLVRNSGEAEEIVQDSFV